MKKTNTDLGSKTQHGRPSSISSSGDQDFSIKKKKSLGSPNGNSPTKLLSKGQLSERLYPKPKPIRHNSSKSITTSFKPLSTEPNEENNMFDLLSTPIDSKTILQYYKSNIKKRVQSLSSAIGVGNEFADITSSAAFKRAKAKIAKNKAATLLVDKLKLIIAKHFMKLVPTNLANFKRDLVLNGSDSSSVARCEARFIHSIAGETSPRVEIMLQDSSNRNVLQSRRQLSDDNKLTKIFSPTGVNFQPSKYWAEADSPTESGHRRVLSNKNLPLKSESTDFVFPSTTAKVEDHSQKMASYKKHRDGKFEAGELKTNKEYFASLIEEDEFKSNSPSVWNSGEIASSLKDSKRFLSNQADEYQLKANISHHKRESSLGYLDNQQDQKKSRLHRPQSNTIKNHVLSKLVRLLKRSDGTYTAFRKIKDFAMGASSVSYGEFKLDSPVIKTAVFPTFSNLSPKTRGFALNLDKIPEYDGDTSNYYPPQFSTKYTADEKYKNVLESMQKRTMGILHFERIYSQLVRKQYRVCFEKFSSKGGDITTLNLNEGLTVRSADLKGSSHLHISQDENIEKISSEGFNSRWQLENLESKNDVERGRKGIQDRDISALEGRLEKSLERKLDSKIQQNLDENLRGRLASELLKLFSQSITSFATKNEASENQGSQTERGTETKYPLDFKRQIETDDRNFHSYRHSSGNEMMQYTPYFQKNVILPVEVNEDQKTVENISELKDYSAISHKEDYPSFNYGSPIKQNTKILDNSNLLSSIGRNTHEFSHSPTKIIPQAYQVEEERKSYSINALSLPSLTPVESHRIKSENSLKNSIPMPVEKNQLYAMAFEKGKSEVAKSVRSFYLLEKVLNRKSNDLLWWAFLQLKFRESPRLNRFLGLSQGQGQNEVVDQNRSLSAYSNLSVSTPINRETQHHQGQMFGFGTLALSHRTFDRSGLDSSRFDITAKHVVMGKLVERLYIETMKFSFFKLHRSYITKKYQYKPLNKNQTLNYLLFAKKVEKIYKNKIRGAFTQLCFKSTGGVKEKKFDLQKFLIGLGLKMKRSGFSRIRAHASKASHLKNSFGRMSALLNQKKLRALSEAFYFIASYGLVRKEYLINLSMMVAQLGEIRKSKLRDAFIVMKEITQGKSLKREALLKHILKQKNLKTRFLLKYAFLKWSRSGTNLSVSVHQSHPNYQNHLHHYTEIRRVGNEKLIKAQLFIHLKNIFSSKALIHKFNAFSKLKHHTSNSNAALGLYTILNRKIWNSLKFGYDGIAKWGQDLDVTPRSMRKRKLERLSRVVKRRLNIGFSSILSHSASVRQPLIKTNHKEGILRLCVIAEDMKQDFLLHGLKMIELYNIYKRNQKNLYINLGLKLYLLFDEKQKANKKYSLDMMFFQFEKNALRQRLVEKLTRKVHQKNLQFFFNRYKNEVVNLKLNYSMVNLAIKDIILAIEKLNKLQRACKALVFRKLSLLVWEKQQQTKESLQFASMIQKQAFQTNKALSSLGSIDFSTVRASSGKPNDERILRGAEHCNNLFAERKFEALKEIYNTARIQNIAEALLHFESNVFQKLVYKRKFLSFAQMKYEHDKRTLRIQSHKSTGILKLWKFLDKHTTFNKKTHFRRLRTLCDLKGQYLEEKLEQFNLYKTKVYFAKWRVALEKEIQRKAQTDTGLAKLEKLFFKKGFFLSQYAFDVLIRNKDYSPKIPLLTYEQVITEASQPSPTRAVKTQPSSQKTSLKNSAVLSSTKSSAGTPKLASNRPNMPHQPNPEQSPSQTSKRASNRPSFGVSTGAASPRTKLPRQSSVMSQSTKNSPTQISTHSSSKNSTSSQFSRSATLKK